MTEKGVRVLGFEQGLRGGEVTFVKLLFDFRQLLHRKRRQVDCCVSPRYFERALPVFCPASSDIKLFWQLKISLYGILWQIIFINLSISCASIGLKLM
jgi:hypothetical protein